MNDAGLELTNLLLLILIIYHFIIRYGLSSVDRDFLIIGSWFFGLKIVINCLSRLVDVPLVLARRSASNTGKDTGNNSSFLSKIYRKIRIVLERRDTGGSGFRWSCFAETRQWACGSSIDIVAPSLKT